jgi:hypothetical protein
MVRMVAVDVFVLSFGLCCVHQQFDVGSTWSILLCVRTIMSKRYLHLKIRMPALFEFFVSVNEKEQSIEQPLMKLLLP